MEGIDETLMAMALHRLGKREKTAFVPAGATDPAAMAGGAPPGAPPPGDPAAAGAAPPTPGGMPPAPQQDPAAMAAAAGGMGAPGMTPQQPLPGTMPAGAPGAMPGQAAAPPKLKPEQMMQMIDTRLYNQQQQLTAIMNHLGITLPPGVLVLPPGMTSAPTAETAVPGGPMDPGPVQGGGAAGAAGADTGAISPIEPMQGAAPAESKAAAFGRSLAEKIAQETAALDDESRADSYIGDPVGRVSPHALVEEANAGLDKAATVMRLLRSRQQANASAAA